MADKKDLNIDLHPEWTGASVDRYMGFPEQGIRLVISAAIPTEEADVQKLYNCTEEQFRAKAVKQLMYDADGDLKALIASGKISLVSGQEEAIAAAYAKCLSTKEKRERTLSPEAKAKASAAREARKAKVTAADELEAKTGVSVAAMAAMSPTELLEFARKLAKGQK